MREYGGMRYQIASKWSLVEHFVITDDRGDPVIDVRGNLGLIQRLTLQDSSGRELAEIKKHLMTTKHDILVGGGLVAQVHHEGFFGERYEIESQYGQISARGNFSGWNYTIHQQGKVIATVSREFSLREKFQVEIYDNVNDVFVLAVVLAIDAIHNERREDRDQGGLFGGGGLLGGNFP